MHQAENIPIDRTMGTWIDIKTTGKMQILRYISLQSNSVHVERYRGIRQLYK